MDHYATLGVAKNAAPEDIKRAYRKLAAQHHPDRGGDTARFQEIQQAYDVLSDPDKRAQYDSPAPQMNQFNFGSGFTPFDDIINQFMRQHRQAIYGTTVAITLEQMAQSQTVEIYINGPQGGRMARITVPPGVEHGQQVRYEGIIPDSLLQVTFVIQPHPEFERRGLDLYTTKIVDVFDLILGTTVLVKTVDGSELEVNVPAMFKPGGNLRIPGRGLPGNGTRGNHYVLINTTFPDKISDELLDAIRNERIGK